VEPDVLGQGIFIAAGFRVRLSFAKNLLWIRVFGRCPRGEQRQVHEKGEKGECDFHKALVVAESLD